MSSVTKISSCTTTACAFNNDGCTAFAVNVGGNADAACTTFSTVDLRAGLAGQPAAGQEEQEADQRPRDQGGQPRPGGGPLQTRQLRHAPEGVEGDPLEPQPEKPAHQTVAQLVGQDAPEEHDHLSRPAGHHRQSRHQDQAGMDHRPAPAPSGPSSSRPHGRPPLLQGMGPRRRALLVEEQLLATQGDVEGQP